MVKSNVFKVMNWKYIPRGTKLINSTWKMRKKPDGNFRTTNAIRGLMQ